MVRRPRSEIESKAVAGQRILTQRFREVYAAVALVGCTLLGLRLDDVFALFVPTELAGFSAFVLAAGLFFSLRRLIFRLPVPSERLALSEVLPEGVRELGEAPAWLLPAASCPVRLRRYVRSRLSPGEFETFLVLAEDSERSVDELVMLVRSL